LSCSFISHVKLNATAQNIFANIYKYASLFVSMFVNIKVQSPRIFTQNTFHTALDLTENVHFLCLIVSPTSNICALSGPFLLSASRFFISCLLWSPCGIGQTIIFSYCGLFFFYLLSSSFFSSPNLSRRRLDVCHTSTHGVALV